MVQYLAIILVLVAILTVATLCLWIATKSVWVVPVPTLVLLATYICVFGDLYGQRDLRSGVFREDDES